MEEYAENPSVGNIYWMLMTVLSIQETRYVSIETIRAFQALFLIDDRTAVMLLDTQEFTLIDKEGIEEELGITFGNYHDTDVRTKAYDKLIAKTYGRKDEESVYETPAPTTIGDLVKSQMCGDAACSPAVELTRCEPTNLKW